MWRAGLLAALAATAVMGAVPEESLEVPAAPAEEVVPEVREDITSQRATVFDTIEGWFWDPKKWIHVSKPRGSKHGLLPHFCNSKDVWKEDTVVSCDCCVDHLTGDPRSQAALLYQSGKTQAPAFFRSGDGRTKQVGMINVWTLGGRVPAVLCDRGRLVCHCEDPVRGWAEFERACRRGQPCEPPEEVEEGVSKGYEEQHQDSEDSQAAEELHEQMEKDAAKEIPPSSLAQNQGHRCDKGDRVPLGQAFCEDFSVEQCERTYARTKSGQHHACEVDPKTFRLCGAQLLSEAEAAQRTRAAMAWAVQNFYSPELDWKVRTINFTTTVVEEPWPSASLFEKQVQHRMDEQGTMEKLKDRKSVV